MDAALTAAGSDPLALLAGTEDARMVLTTLRDLGVPIVCGTTRRVGGTRVELNARAMASHAHLMVPGSLAIVGLMDQSLTVQVRLGQADTWLECVLADFADHNDEFDEDECEDDGDDELPGDPAEKLDDELTRDQINALAARVAWHPQFAAAARRPVVRYELTHDVVLPDVGPLCPESYVHAISTTAATLWEFYVVPIQVAELEATGLKPSEIANRLGITLARVKRAGSVETPTNFAGILEAGRKFYAKD